MSELGSLVRYLRLRGRLRRQDLGDHAGVGVALVHRLESDRVVYVTDLQVKALAEALDVPESSLWKVIPSGQKGPRYYRVRVES